MTICGIEAFVQVIAILFCRKRISDKQLTLDFYLCLSATGLLALSVVDMSLSMAIMFFLLGIVVSSQLFGVRAAFRWYMMNLVAILLHYLILSMGFAAGPIPLDEMMLSLGIVTCVFVCCWQGEQFYQERTNTLFEFSEGLRRKSEHLRHLATTDSLTGLVNRFQFQELLKSEVRHAVAKGEQMALFLVDMDGFKQLNDTLGHLAGDDALIEIARRLNEEFDGVAEVARLGGDEFCMICKGVDEARAESVAHRIQEILTARYGLGESQVALGASVGYAFCPEDTTSEQDLLSFADTAMYHAKENRLGVKRYEPSMTAKLIEQRDLQERLATALRNNEFFLVYQPQVDLWTGEVFGVEALLRWRCNGEIIPPNRFISALENSYDIIPVGKWIIRECCRQMAQWNAKGFDVCISINVSPVQFRDSEFVNSIVDPLEEYNIDPAKLDFEITESLLVIDVEDATAKLKKVKQTGASVSIDDFGTGYSSLAYLRQFPIDRLKIDRAFIKDIPDSDDGTIAASVIVLAKALGLSVLAEGVETQEHIDFLKAHDCDKYQGYWFSRPVSPGEVEEYFQRSDQVASPIDR